MEFNLHRLQLLRELKHRGTLSAVATAMSYSASAVSQQLALLEKEIGVTLLVQDGRRLRLTPQAEILVHHCDAVLTRFHEAEAEISASLQELTGTIRVATIQTVALALVPRALTWLAAHHPKLRVKFCVTDPEFAVSALLVREFGLIVDEVYPGRPMTRSDQIDQAVLSEEAMRLASVDPLPATKTLESLAGAPWAMEPLGSPAREWTLAVCRRAGYEPDVVHESNDMLVIARLVEAGHAVALLPDMVWLDQPARVELRQLSPTHTRRVVTTCRSGSRDHPMVQAVRDGLAFAWRTADAAK